MILSFINLLGKFLLIICLGAIALGQNSTKNQYLANNYEVLFFDKANAFRFFDKKFYQNDIFLVGEMHGTANSYKVQQLLLDEIKRKTNFTNYLVELDYVDAARINKYLVTGDEKILQSVFAQYKGVFYYCKEYYDVFTHIFQINQKLKEKDRIKLIGVETVSPNKVKNLDFLEEILAEVNYKKGSLQILDEIYQYKNKEFSYSEWKKLFISLIEDVKNNRQKYEKILGKKFWEFNYLAENFAASFAQNEKRSGKPLTDEDVETIRDTQMAKNFQTQYEHFKLKKQKFFGFFGREHIYQSYAKQTQWMTAQIKKNNQQLKIVSFSLRYLNCNFMIPTSFLPTKQDKLFFYGGFQNDDSPFVKAIGINDLNGIEPNAETILFKLDEQNSPYRNLPDLVEKIDDGKSTVDYFNFAILLRNSMATTPISEK